VNYGIQSLKYFFHRRVLFRRFLDVSDTVFNLKLRISIPDAMGRQIFKRGSLYPAHINFFKQIPFEKGDVVLDIGANIGWYSLALAKNISSDITFFAFEPEPLNFSLLQQNQAQNKTTNLILENKAISDKTGHSILFLYHPKNSGRHSLLDINPQTKKSVSVETTRLDDFLSNKKIDVQRVKFIKIDIEGYEFFALKSGIELMKVLPYMFIEFSPASIRKGGQDPAEFIAWLQELNFSFYNINSGQAVLRTDDYLKNTTQTENFQLVKKGHMLPQPSRR
jgi:FkbM family methyltransferase